jgi:hypothetical protein
VVTRKIWHRELNLHSTMVSFSSPEGPGLGLEINEDWLKSHMEKGETWWG